MFANEVASFVQALILPYSIPVMTFSKPTQFHRIKSPTITTILERHVAFNLERRRRQAPFQLNQLLVAADRYLFTMAPDSAKIFQLLDNLANHFGWKQVGLVTAESRIFEEEINTHLDIHSQHTRYYSEIRFLIANSPAQLVLLAKSGPASIAGASSLASKTIT